MLKENRMKETNGQKFKFRMMHLDQTLLRTRTSNTLIDLLIKCRKFVDDDLQERIDYVVQRRKDEIARVEPARRKRI